MPKYVYKCADCEFIFEANHSIKDKLKDCPSCNITNSLGRLPTSFSVVKPNSTITNQKAGTVTKEKIEEFREELKSDKEKLKNRDYKE
tara:strand:+ start:64 stop:327 length:264 start_codon:yes stop_codon:yes gene_type:complete